MEAALAAAVPILLAIIAALGTWLAKARRLSGRIERSEATDLWKEASLMRNDYRSRLQMADDRIRDLEGRLARCEEELRAKT